MHEAEEEEKNLEQLIAIKSFLKASDLLFTMDEIKKSSLYNNIINYYLVNEDIPSLTKFLDLSESFDLDDDGPTRLIIAAAVDASPEIVELLIKTGVDPLPVYKGITAGSLAVIRGIFLLLENCLS